ncbi:MAG: PAS domain S-box protein [Flavobacteriales bacterium]|nr:PAS domain S-box protein [Flavobacteriales bacterium]
MSNNNQLNLQLVLNQLLELDLKYDDVSVILKKALNIILKSPISDKFLKRGVIMLVEENGKKLKLVAHKNASLETISNCKKVAFGECICGKAALTKTIQYSNNNCVDHQKKYKEKEGNHGHYSLPILYHNDLLGVLTIYLTEQHKKNNEEITALETITKTLALILHKKKDAKYLNFIKNRLDKSYGNEYFKVLAKFLTKELGMKYCIIGQYDAKSEIVKTIVFVNGQKVLKNLVYSIKGTPCHTVVGKDTCFYPSNVQQLFPDDKDLVSLGVESYFGKLLNTANDGAFGLIAFMSDKTIDNEQEKKEILNLFLPRLVSECERKKYEDKLILNEKKYKDVFDKFQDVFVRATLLSNGESIITEVSPSIFKFSGYKPSELIGKPSSSFYRDISQREEMLKILVRDKQIKDYPLTFEKKNGDVIYAQVTSQLIYEGGIPIEIRVVARDVTERRNDEIRKDISYLIAKKTQRRITNINSLSEYIYKVLGNIIDNSNFSIALLNQTENKIDFPIYFDEKVENNKQFSRPITNGLFEYIINTRNRFVKTKSELEKIIIDNKLDYKKTLPKIIISFPLKSEGLVVGALTVKSYKKEQQFTLDDIDLLDFIATQLSSIIEKEQWQSSLIEKEKYFRSLVESSLEVTGIVGDDAKINYISESVKNIMGYPAHFFIGKCFHEFIPKKYYESAIGQFEKVINGKPFHNPFLVKLVSNDKGVRIIQYTLNNQLKNKEIKGIIFNAQDITEKHYNQKKLIASQEALFNQQENYRTIFNHANDGIIRIDKKFNIIECNKRMISILGYSKKELLTKSIFDITLKSDIPVIKQRMKKLAKRELTKISIEKRSVHKNGKQVVCKVYVKPILDENKHIDYYIAFITDITKRVDAIKRATDLEKALEQSANVLFVNTKGVIINAGKKVAINTGYSIKELIGRSTKLFNSGFHSKDFFKQMWKTIQSGQVWSGEIQNKKKDGTLYWLFMTIIPIKDIDNNIEYYINIRHDITQEKILKINNIREVINAQEQEKENFAKELHDGMGQMLLASKMNLDAIKPEIEQLDGSTISVYNNSVKLLTQAIQEARTVSHGLMSRVLNQFGLAYSIKDMLKNNEIAERKIKFDYVQNINEERFGGELEKGLYRVLQELTSNIVKHSEATYAKIEILKKGKNLHIRVTDNGVGIMNNITKPTTKLGIGLKNIETRINYLSGLFSINQEYKNGSEIIIVVPIVKE